MLKISKLADYGTVLMSIMARHPEQLQSASDLAQKTRIAVPTVSKLLKLLQEDGLVKSVRGSNGGYHLAKEPKAISLAAIIAAIDGKPALTECSKGMNICEHDQICGIRHRWRAISQTIATYLESLNLTDLNAPLTKISQLDKRL